MSLKNLINLRTYLLIGVIAIERGFDLFLTSIGLRLGLVESNPFMRMLDINLILFLNIVLILFLLFGNHVIKQIEKRIGLDAAKICFFTYSLIATMNFLVILNNIYFIIEVFRSG